jgi:aryl-alcohol dehydrogenase-like predicted oxidoreductase
LTGQIKSHDYFAEDDWRRMSPRFQDENFQKNLDLVKKVNELASKKNCTAAQLALAWVIAQGDNIFPIPGTKRVKYLEENAGAINVTFSKDELDTIAGLFPKNAAAGDRYPTHMMSLLNK